MNMLENIIFTHPQLELQFRKKTGGSKEVGGWLFVSSWPMFWPGQYSDRLKNQIFGSRLMVRFINAFLLAPNEAKKKEEQYRPWDWTKAQALVNETSRVYGMPIQFHTHPGSGSKVPSAADIAVSVQYDQLVSNWVMFVIVTTKPLRLWPYELRWGTLQSPERGDMKMGNFHSWRTKKVRQLAGR